MVTRARFLGWNTANEFSGSQSARWYLIEEASETEGVALETHEETARSSCWRTGAHSSFDISPQILVPSDDQKLISWSFRHRARLLVRRRHEVYHLYRVALIRARGSAAVTQLKGKATGILNLGTTGDK